MHASRPTLPSTAALAAAIFLPALAPQSSAAALHREWCTRSPGRGGQSWGFALTPDSECREIRLRVATDRVRVVDATPGPGLPPDWTVELTDGKEIRAAGESPLAAGQVTPTALIVETDRPTGGVLRGGQGVLPVKWEITEGLANARVTAFDPVLELSDAVSRGLVRTSIKLRDALGPVELHVENPTQRPLWLDLPPGSLLRHEDGDWVVGLVGPYRMSRRQKVGRTVRAFPLTPDDAGTHRAPPQLSDGVHPAAPLISELAIAAQKLERRDYRQAKGRFERLLPCEFWALVFKWSVWSETAAPSVDLLGRLVGDLLLERADLGDEAVAELDPEAATLEVLMAHRELLGVREAQRQTADLPAWQLASRARFDGQAACR